MRPSVTCSRAVRRFTEPGKPEMPFPMPLQRLKSQLNRKHPGLRPPLWSVAHRCRFAKDESTLCHQVLLLLLTTDRICLIAGRVNCQFLGKGRESYLPGGSKGVPIRESQEIPSEFSFFVSVPIGTNQQGASGSNYMLDAARSGISRGQRCIPTRRCLVRESARRQPNLSFLTL